MRRLLRVALLWLVAFSLPLQATAVARMVNCEQGFRAMSASGHHDHAAMLRDAAIESHDGQGQDEHSGSPRGKCSLCFSCCVGAGLLTVAPRIASVDLPESFMRTFSIGAPEFVTAGPERPPRPFLA